jgi:hypothetical protein
MINGYLINSLVDYAAKKNNDVVSPDLPYGPDCFVVSGMLSAKRDFQNVRDAASLAACYGTFAQVMKALSAIMKDEVSLNDAFQLTSVSIPRPLQPAQADDRLLRMLLHHLSAGSVTVYGLRLLLMMGHFAPLPADKSLIKESALRQIMFDRVATFDAIIRWFFSHLNHWNDNNINELFAGIGLREMAEKDRTATVNWFISNQLTTLITAAMVQGKKMEVSSLIDYFQAIQMSLPAIYDELPFDIKKLIPKDLQPNTLMKTVAGGNVILRAEMLMWYAGYLASVHHTYNTYANVGPLNKVNAWISEMPMPLKPYETMRYINSFGTFAAVVRSHTAYQLLRELNIDTLLSSSLDDLLLAEN